MEIASGVSHPKCINSSNPYHDCVEYCFERIAAAGGKSVENGRHRVYQDCVFACFFQHKCDEHCSERRERAKLFMERVVGGVLTEGGRTVHPGCINASNPYHECVDYCFKRIANQMKIDRETIDVLQTTTQVKATISTSEDIKPKPSAKEIEVTGQILQTSTLKASTMTNTPPEDVKPIFLLAEATTKGESGQDLRTTGVAETTQSMENSKSKSSIKAATITGENGQGMGTTTSATATPGVIEQKSLIGEATTPGIKKTGLTEHIKAPSSEPTLKSPEDMPVSFIDKTVQETQKTTPATTEGAVTTSTSSCAKFSAAVVIKTEPSEHLDRESEELVTAKTVQACEIMELGLEEEARKRQEARVLRKRKKSDISRPSPQEDDDEQTEYKLTLRLLEYERLGYLTLANNEEDDESLMHYGDKFGLAVLNEYPKFFIQVPQHPHYGETSLDKVKKETAETFWDLFMPLMRRGIAAVRENKENEIAAVERMIARLTKAGFDLKHLQAYINTSRQARSEQAIIRDELERVKLKIEIEKKEIDDVILGRPLTEVIMDLEEKKAMCQKLMAEIISDIDSSLAKTRRFLGKEKIIRNSKTTLELDTLLDFKVRLERKIEEANSKAKTLLLQ